MALSFFTLVAAPITTMKINYSINTVILDRVLMLELYVFFILNVKISKQ